MKYRKLGNTGLEVSILSFGASSLGGVFHEIDEGEGIRAVNEAVEQGINLVDVSPFYGLTKAETVLGKAIKEIQRNRFLLSTKAGRYGSDDFDFSSSRLIQSVDESLKRLNTEYIDILYLHDIEFGSITQILEESIPTLNRLKEQGKIRFTGVSGLPLRIYNQVLESAQIDSILSYCHYSLNDQALLQILPLLKEKGVGLVNASPLSMGLLSDRGAPVWHPASQRIKQVCAEAAAFCKMNGLDLSKLAIQFSVSNEDIPTTLVSTSRSAAIKQNAAWAMEPIDLEALDKVMRILQPILNETWPSGRPENE